MNKQQIAIIAESNQFSELPSKVGSAPLKKMTSVSKICAKVRVEQFPDDFYAKGNILFCNLSPSL